MIFQNKVTNNVATLLFSVLMLTGCGNEQAENKLVAPWVKPATNINIWPDLNIEVKKSNEIEEKITYLLSRMTIEQKVAQMIQPEIRDITVEDMRKYGFGSYLNGGGSFPNGNKHATPEDWIKLAEAMYQASIDDSLDGSSIPTMWGTDAVHGHNNIVGATLFPHNIGLGAANNPALIEKIAEITAKEVMVTGIDWVFAPTVAVVRDDRWGRTYEGYSEDPEIVRSYSSAIVKGLQGHADKDFLSDRRVISSIKHFIGDGGTQAGDDQGDNISTEQTLFDIHGQGYVGGLTAGAQSVMASFNSWYGQKVHGNKYLLTDVLKNRMGFDGFVVGDWNGHGQIEGCTNNSCPQAINAGLDIFMVPTDIWKPLLENTIAQVRAGKIRRARIDDAVSRILRVKLRAGIFDKPSPIARKFSGQTALIGAKAHRDVAKQAVRESLVLLKNKNNLLPIAANQNILVVGDGADNIGKQSGGWSVTWQGTGNTNDDFPGATSIFQGIAQQVAIAGGTATLSADGSYQDKPDVAIVVYGEDPYAEGNGDLDNLDFQQGDNKHLSLLRNFKRQGIPVVSLFISGRPMWVNEELNASDAFVAVWLPGSEGSGIADVVLADQNGNIQHDFKGKLSFSWPNAADQTMVNRNDASYSPLLPYGFGLTYGDKNLLLDNLNESTTITKRSPLNREIFTGSMKKPWLLRLFSGKEEIEVSSNTHQFSTVNYRTVDKKIQEDAFKLTLAGGVRSGVKMVSEGNYSQDLRVDLAAESALKFDIKLSENPSDNVILSMYCANTDECVGSKNMTDVLNMLPLDEWHTISVDLICFSKSGANLADVTTAFELSSVGQLEISLANIALIPNQKGKSSINCHH
ncbi:MAG: exo 1,3/1,4-beta-D-glucan glucohydrolase [Colwellia sp.]|nr:exo 1,3/1,4-beta-D-glucan glucohydrolase [Colwellia sp.]